VGRLIMRRFLLFLFCWLSMPAAAGPGVVIVSGGTLGIGYELVKMLYEQGWSVATFARSPEKVEALRKQFPDPKRFLAEPLSVMDLNGVRRFVTDVQTSLGPITHLVNNAGTTGPLVRAGDISSQAIHDTIATNLTGAINLTGAVLEQMMKLGVKGVIVNVSSGSSKGVPGLATYAATKAGINVYTASVAEEYGHHGIRAFALNPGHVDTRLQTAVREANPSVFPAAPAFVGYHERGELVEAEHSAAHIQYLLQHPEAFPNGSYVSYRQIAERLYHGGCDPVHLRYLSP